MTTSGTVPLKDRLIVALDLPTVEAARALVDRLGASVGFYKVGLELLFCGGADLVRDLVAEGNKVFVDAKLLDIERTTAAAARAIAALGAHFLTVHAHGATIRAAVEGCGDSGLKILAVTVLTSFGPEDLAEMGATASVEDLVLARTRIAREAGAGGVIASGREAAAIRAMAGGDLTIVTPGIRSAGVGADDQKRITTPAQAIAAGADHIVVGRQITTAPDPRAEAERLLAEIAGALAT